MGIKYIVERHNVATITRREYRSLAEIRHRIRFFLAFSEDRARSAGLEPAQHQLLLAIEGLPPKTVPTVGTLARRLGVRHHSAVELANRAERARLIRRTKAADDQRVVTLALTARGKALLVKLALEHREELRRAAPALVKELQAVIRGAR